MTGAIYYPSADRSQWFQDNYNTGGFTSGPEKIVLHMTEGTSWPSYGGGAKAPHLTVMGDFDRYSLAWRQHFRLDRYARALRNEPGGVQTNIDGALQVEIVGTCDRKFTSNAPHLRSWSLPDWAIDGLGTFVAWCHDEYGIPFAYPSEWPAYPSSHEADRRVRMSGKRWDSFRGVCGHLHVPENDHLDPGDIRIREIIERAMEGQPVALTGEDKQWILDQLGAIAPKVWQGKNADIIRILGAEGSDNPTWTPESVIRATLDEIRQLRVAVEALQSGTVRSQHKRG